MIKFAALGGIIGAVLGLLGGIRTTSEGAANALADNTAAAIVIPAVAGAVTGILLHWLTDFRSQGIFHHYVGWILACVGGVACAAASLLIDGVSWEEASGVIFLGVVGGAGLGAFARLLRAEGLLSDRPRS